MLLLYLIMILHLLPMNLFTWGMFQTGVLGAFHNFSSLFCRSFDMCCWHGIRMRVIPKINYDDEMKHQATFIVFVLFSVEYKLGDLQMILFYSISTFFGIMHAICYIPFSFNFKMHFFYKVLHESTVQKRRCVILTFKIFFIFLSMKPSSLSKQIHDHIGPTY